MDKEKKLSDKEKAQRYRLKHKEAVNERNKLRMREKRKKEKDERLLNLQKNLAYRVTETKRKQLYRKKKQEESIVTSSNTSTYYKSPQSFGKALAKIRKTLPKSPNKKKSVVLKLAKEVGVKIEKEVRKSRDSEKKIIVKDFFYNQDIVYTSPGRKDEIVYWEEGKKVRERKHFLTMSLKEAFSIFKERNPEITIGFSTFCKLRPQNVLHLSSTPPDQCKCQMCENFFLKLSSLKITYDSKLFWENVLCDETINSVCWKGSCDFCKNGEKINFPSDVQVSEKITFKVWEKSESKRLQCSIKEVFYGELKEMLVESFGNFSRHINTKRVQALEFYNDKQSASKRTLQIDFAMNYSCEFQNEIQSALWARNSVTLFTAATTLSGVLKTYIICSDVVEKEKNTVACFIKKLYETMEPKPDEIPDIEEVIWSDGPTSEFKNRFMVYFLQEMSKQYKKKFSWKYFATSHGKGVVDGVGGHAKSLVYRQVMSKSKTAPIVQNAKDFSSVLSKLMLKTEVICIETKNVKSHVNWENATPVENIMQKHVITVSDEEIILKENACDNLAITSSIQLGLKLQLNDWVMAKYESEFYPGLIVAKLDETNFKISVMVKAGNQYWKWPDKADELVYPIEDIIKKIGPPEIVNSRGNFKFENF